MTKVQKDNAKPERDRGDRGTGTGEMDQTQTPEGETGATRSVKKPIPMETVGDAERDKQHRENGTPRQFR